MSSEFISLVGSILISLAAAVAASSAYGAFQLFRRGGDH